MRKTQHRRNSATSPIHKVDIEEDDAYFGPSSLRNAIAKVEWKKEFLDRKIEALNIGDGDGDWTEWGRLMEKLVKLPHPLKVGANLIDPPKFAAGVILGRLMDTSEEIDVGDTDRRCCPDVKSTSYHFRQNTQLYSKGDHTKRFEEVFGFEATKTYCLVELDLEDWVSLVNIRGRLILETRRPNTVEDWNFCLETDKLSERLYEEHRSRQSGQRDYCGLHERVLELYRTGYELCAGC